MLITVPQLRGLHEQLLLARLDSIERLVADAQHVTGVDIVIVVEEQLDHVAVGVLAGDDAVIEVAEVSPWACWFLGARSWVPVLVIDLDGVGVVGLARTSVGRNPLGYFHGVRQRRGNLG